MALELERECWKEMDWFLKSKRLGVISSVMQSFLIVSAINRTILGFSERGFEKVFCRRKERAFLSFGIFKWSGREEDRDF